MSKELTTSTFRAKLEKLSKTHLVGDNELDLLVHEQEQRECIAELVQALKEAARVLHSIAIRSDHEDGTLMEGIFVDALSGHDQAWQVIANVEGRA